MSELIQKKVTAGSTVAFVVRAVVIFDAGTLSRAPVQ
jgi:hypothetical protein